MKTLVLLLAATSLGLLPLAGDPPGEGHAAAAVAATGLSDAAAGAVGPQGGTLVFVLSGSGKMTHLEGGPTPGEKPFKNTIKLDAAVECIAGIGSGCDADSLDLNETDPGVYLFFDGVTTWRLATNPAGDNAVTLEGLVDGKGGFMMAGTHTSTDGDTSIFLTGKVKFAPDSLSPVKLNGKFTVVSTDEAHYASGTFKTTGALLQ